jgi:hemerythrin-like domain-containing protein
MTELLSRNIKDVIASHPDVGPLLAGHGIACATCAVGTCLTRDIIEVHGLSPEKEHEVLEALAAIVYPGRALQVPTLPRKPTARGGAALSPPIRMLVDEHVTIKRWLALVPRVGEALRQGAPGSADAAWSGIGFLRAFADRYHHAKEEEVLFGRFDGGIEILSSMRAEHEVARSLVRSAASALDGGDLTVAAEDLRAHGELLIEHIRKEDEILFPWMDGRLGTSEVGTLYAAFSGIEASFADERSTLLASIERLEAAFPR